MANSMSGWTTRSSRPCTTLALIRAPVPQLMLAYHIAVLRERLWTSRGT